MIELLAMVKIGHHGVIGQIHILAMMMVMFVMVIMMKEEETVVVVVVEKELVVVVVVEELEGWLLRLWLKGEKE